MGKQTEAFEQTANFRQGIWWPEPVCRDDDKNNMLTAFRNGLPAEGKLFPDGSKVVKIFWSFKKNEVSPYSVNVPDTLKELAFHREGHQEISEHARVVCADYISPPIQKGEWTSYVNAKCPGGHEQATAYI